MDYAATRSNMIEGQIRPNGVTDTVVLEAMSSVPRERFVPHRLRGVAYADEDLPLEKGRSLMEPMVCARLLQSAAIAPDDVVLEIGTGCGYVTSVLSRIASTVVSLESDSALASQAISVLTSLGVDNAAVVSGDLSQGCPAQGPYNVIFVNGAVEVVPEAWLEQLADGGRLIVVVNRNGQGTAFQYTRAGKTVGHRPVFDANVSVFPEFQKRQAFVF